MFKQHPVFLIAVLGSAIVVAIVLLIPQCASSSFEGTLCVGDTVHFAEDTAGFRVEKDGVNYDDSRDNPPVVTIAGFTYKSGKLFQVLYEADNALWVTSEDLVNWNRE